MKLCSFIGLLMIFFFLYLTLASAELVRGSLHQHTGYSTGWGYDGLSITAGDNCGPFTLEGHILGKTVEELAEDAEDLGLSFLGFSDHSYCLTTAEFNVVKSDCASADASDPDFTCLVGEELSTRDVSGDDETLFFCENPDTGEAHLGAYGLTSFISQSPSDVHCPSSPTAQGGINAINAQGGISILNHPKPDGGFLDFEAIDSVSGYSGIEVWNSDFDSDDQDALNYWIQEFLQEGDQPYIYSGTDDHEGVDDVNYNYVDVGSLTSSGVKAGLQAGRVVISNNGYLTVEAKTNTQSTWTKMGGEFDANVGEILTVRIEYDVESSCLLRVRVPTIGGFLETIEDSETISGGGLMDFNYPVSVEGDYYIRVDCIGSGGDTRIYANPIWFDVLDPGCMCSSYVPSGSCGQGSCSDSERPYSRICNPSACAVETECIFDSSCVDDDEGGIDDVVECTYLDYEYCIETPDLPSYGDCFASIARSLYDEANNIDYGSVELSNDPYVIEEYYTDWAEVDAEEVYYDVDDIHDDCGDGGCDTGTELAGSSGTITSATSPSLAYSGALVGYTDTSDYWCYLGWDPFSPSQTYGSVTHPIYVLNCFDDSDCSGGMVCDKTGSWQTWSCVSGFPDGTACTSNGQCGSNYCDNDGAGAADDNWCFTPYSTYFDGEEPSYCEYSTGSGIADCDEKQVGTDLNVCVGASYYEEECSSSCGYQDITSDFECNESGCSCAQPLCDGLSADSPIPTCASGATYFADQCSSTASGEDRGDVICRSSAYAASCTAHSACNGIEAGTGNCDSSCQPINHPSIDFVSPPTPSDGSFLLEGENVTVEVSFSEEIDTAVLVWDPPIITKTPSTEEVCDLQSCRLTIYSGTRYVYEDEEWKEVENARSLKDKGFRVVYLEEDDDFDLRVVDFNYTSITLDMSVTEKEVGNDIPVRFWKLNDTKEDYTGNYKEDYLHKADLRKRFESTNSLRATYDFNIGDILEFGHNSTTIMLQDADTENLEDVHIDFFFPDTNLGNETRLRVRNGDYRPGIIYIKFSGFQESIPEDKVITNAVLYLQRYDGNCGSLCNFSIYGLSNDTWTEEIPTWDQPLSGNISLLDSQLVSSTGLWGWDVTSFVSDIFIAGDQNVSFEMRGDDLSINDWAYFRSKEYGSVTERPILNITYSTKAIINYTMNINASGTGATYTVEAPEENIYTYWIWANNTLGVANLSLNRSLTVLGSPPLNISFVSPPTPEEGANLTEGEDVTVEVSFNETIDTAVLVWDPPIITRTASTEEVCEGVTCTMMIYSGTRFVQEDDDWVAIEEAKSLKNKGFNAVYLEKDTEYPLSITDFNYTSITVKFNPESEKTYKEDIPLKIWNRNLTKETAFYRSVSNGAKKLNGIKDFQEKMDKRIDTTIPANVLNQDNELVYDFPYGSVLEFGYNSTIIQLQDNETENIDDASVIEHNPDDNSGYNVILRLNQQSATWDNDMYIKFNLSVVPESAVIQSSTLGMYHYEDADWTAGTGGGSMNIFQVYSDIVSWNEGTITWNNQPCGIDFVSSTNCEFFFAQSLNDPPAWEVLSVTEIVNDSYHAGWTDVSLGIQAGSDTHYYAYFHSKENTTDPLLRPYLNITYTPADVKTIVNYTMNLNGSATGASYTVVSPEANNYTYWIWANSTSGDSGLSNNRSLTVMEAPPPQFIYNYTNLTNDYTNTIIEFQVLNALSAGPYYWTLDFGDAITTNNSESIYLAADESIYVIAQHNYSSPGSYNVTLTASNGTTEDSQELTLEVI